MRAVETLTDEERFQLAHGWIDTCKKALSIIDAQAEINAAMSAQIAAIQGEHRNALDETFRVAHRAETAEARVRELDAERDEARTVRKRLDERIANQRIVGAEMHRQLEAAKDVIGSLNERVQRLEIRLEHDGTNDLQLDSRDSDSHGACRGGAIDGESTVVDSTSATERIEALEILLAASEARAAQWQADARGYQGDATVAQDRLAALRAKVAAAENAWDNADRMLEALRG